MESVRTIFFELWRLARIEWNGLYWNSLIFGRLEEAALAVIGLALVLVLAVLIARSKKRVPGRTFVLVPSVLPSFRSAGAARLRHLIPLLIFSGLAFFLIAFADPYLNLVRQEVRVKGNKIVIMVDSSGSMGSGNYDFRAEQLKVKGTQVYYSAVAGAELFVKTRMEKGQKDLMALILFGHESYVIVPFTQDYQTILTSLSLVGEPEEYKRFPDKDTKIASSISQAVNLFRSFKFIDSSGNAMVLFSDGEDGQVIWEGLSVKDILASAEQGRVPVYFIRTRTGLLINNGVVTNVIAPAIYDFQWRKAIEATGGKFYLADEEKVILQAVEEINEFIQGEFDTSAYATKRPYFLIFLLAAFAMWSLAALLYFTRGFSQFP